MSEMLTFEEVPVGKCYRAFYVDGHAQYNVDPEKFPADWHKISENQAVRINSDKAGQIATFVPNSQHSLKCRKIIPYPGLDNSLKQSLLDKLPSRKKEEVK